MTAPGQAAPGQTVVVEGGQPGGGKPGESGPPGTHTETTVVVNHTETVVNHVVTNNEGGPNGGPGHDGPNGPGHDAPNNGAPGQGGPNDPLVHAGGDPNHPGQPGQNGDLPPGTGPQNDALVHHDGGPPGTHPGDGSNDQFRTALESGIAAGAIGTDGTLVAANFATGGDGTSLGGNDWTGGNWSGTNAFGDQSVPTDSNTMSLVDASNSNNYGYNQDSGNSGSGTNDTPGYANNDYGTGSGAYDQSGYQVAANLDQPVATPDAGGYYPSPEPTNYGSYSDASYTAPPEAAAPISEYQYNTNVNVEGVGNQSVPTPVADDYQAPAAAPVQIEPAVQQAFADVAPLMGSVSYNESVAANTAAAEQQMAYQQTQHMEMQRQQVEYQAQQQQQAAQAQYQQYQAQQQAQYQAQQAQARAAAAGGRPTPAQQQQARANSIASRLAKQGSPPPQKQPGIPSSAQQGSTAAPKQEKPQDLMSTLTYGNLKRKARTIKKQSKDDQEQDLKNLKNIQGQE
jgi:hypothetical protein